MYFNFYIVLPRSQVSASRRQRTICAFIEIIFPSFYLITGQLKLIVKLKGEAKNKHSKKAGIYFLGPNTVDGKLHWLQDSGTSAIYYNKHTGYWNIGSQDGIGKSLNSPNTVGIYTAEDVADPREATTWHYASGGKWIMSEDILVDTFKPGTWYIDNLS